MAEDTYIPNVLAIRGYIEFVAFGTYKVEYLQKWRGVYIIRRRIKLHELLK